VCMCVVAVCVYRGVFVCVYMGMRKSVFLVQVINGC
jgi:hypothetical protein